MARTSDSHKPRGSWATTDTRLLGFRVSGLFSEPWSPFPVKEVSHTVRCKLQIPLRAGSASFTKRAKEIYSDKNIGQDARISNSAHFLTPSCSSSVRNLLWTSH